MVKSNKQWVKLSGYLFLLGIIIAIVEGLVSGVIPSAGTIIVVLGFLIGLFSAFGMGSIGNESKEMFMMAAIALMVVGASGAALKDVPYIGSFLAPIVGYIAALVAPAIVIIAVKEIWNAGSIKYM
ncbi:MAG: hypothetical protein PHU12_01055 [Candidatus Aenigmarchaeota archaeon]|nr:hypothetical protein [Candidatus Aenigmarchaeota archaeon]